MPNQVDSEGVFKFEVLESAIGITNKSSFPQWVARLKAKEKYIESKEEMEHFKLTAPGYVPWDFDEEIIAYLVLFKSVDTFTTEGKEKTSMLNYDQLKLALGWDGTEFDTLADGSYVGKVIQGRTKNEEYDGKVSLKVSWIDSVDAPPTRELKSLAPDAISALTKKLQINVKKVAAAPAKPVLPGKPSTPAASVPSSAASSATASSPTASPPAAPAPSPTTSPTTTSPSSPPKTKKEKKAPVATPPPPAVEKSDRPKTATQGEAWEFVCANKGENEDTVVEESWLSACTEVLGERDQDTTTPEEWAKIRDIALKDLAV